MQKIRYNFRQTDDPLELNEHFLAVSSTGIKFGFDVSRSTGLVLSIAPGGLMTEHGISILETEPVSVTMTAVPEGMLRNDIAVAEYEYAETNPPNSCLYKVVEGTPDALDPQFPTLSANQYPIAKLKLCPNLVSELGFTAIMDIEQVYSNTRIDLPIDGPLNRTVLVQASYDNNSFTVSNSDVILDRVSTKIKAATYQIKNHQPLEASFSTDSGEVTVNLGINDSKFNSRAYIKSDSVHLINSINMLVYSSLEDRKSNTTSAISLTWSDMGTPNKDGKLFLPCQDIHSIISIDAQTSAGTPVDITIGLNRVIALCAVNTGSVKEAEVRVMVDHEYKYFIDQNGCKYSKNRCSILGILDGDIFSNVAMLDGKYIYRSIQKDPGNTRLYHFLGHDYYSVGITGIENVEVYNSNIGIVDRTGAVSIYKGSNYTTVYYTGSDTTKNIECTIDFGGLR